MKSIHHRSIKILGTIVLLISTAFNAYSLDYKAYRTEKPPVIDGIASEECWKSATWAYLNHPFDGKTTIPDSADFYGRYKIVWDAARVYVLMEITDDKLRDNRTNPTDRYWDDDCAEFFFDEDNTPEGHECGANAFNAFAYHIAAVARDKNNYRNGSILPFDDPNSVNHVIDLGADCNTNNAINLDHHVGVKIVQKGNSYTWELAFKIFDKNYDQNSSNNVPVDLTPDKVMGFAIAYCDNDTGVRDNMIGSIPNHNDYNGPYPFYRFTNELGTLTLNDSVLSPNTAVHSTSMQHTDFLFPNPVKDIVSIRVGDHLSKYNRVDIVNLSGTTLLTNKLEGSITQIDISRFPSQAYILQLSGSGDPYKQLFIKE